MKLCILGTPKISIENERAGSYKQKIQGVVKRSVWKVELALCQSFDKRHSNKSQD